MKKKVIIGLIVLALVIVAIAIPKSTYQRWFGKKDENNKSPEAVFGLTLRRHKLVLPTLLSGRPTRWNISRKVKADGNKLTSPAAFR